MDWNLSILLRKEVLWNLPVPSYETTYQALISQVYIWGIEAKS